MIYTDIIYRRLKQWKKIKKKKSYYCCLTIVYMLVSVHFYSIGISMCTFSFDLLTTFHCSHFGLLCYHDAQMLSCKASQDTPLWNLEWCFFWGNIHMLFIWKLLSVVVTIVYAIYAYEQVAFNYIFKNNIIMYSKKHTRNENVLKHFYECYMICILYIYMYTQNILS